MLVAVFLSLSLSSWLVGTPWRGYLLCLTRFGLGLNEAEVLGTRMASRAALFTVYWLSVGGGGGGGGHKYT